MEASVGQQEWQPPEWWYRNRRPPNDDAYFENMCRVIFEAGLNWRVIDKKWATTQKAFCNFNIEEVARFTDADVARLLGDTGIIRNRGKIKAIIQNAQNFVVIKRRYGSFRRYLDSLDKSDNYSHVVKDLINKFKWLGPSTAGTYLYTVGEDIDVWGH